MTDCKLFHLFSMLSSQCGSIFSSCFFSPNKRKLRVLVLFFALVASLLMTLCIDKVDAKDNQNVDVCVVDSTSPKLPVQADFAALPDKNNMFRARKVAQAFVSREQRDGAGATVYRSIGGMQQRNLDPFLMLDEFEVGLPAGFPDHPHRGFETVTYVFPWSKGGLQHEDFMGNKGTLRAGDLQWMTPGKGILHAEMPESATPAVGLQLWINLPKARKAMEPRYQELNGAEVPHVKDEAKGIEARIIAGEVFGQRGKINTEAPVTYIHFIMKKSSTLEFPIPQGHNSFLYILKGAGKVAETTVKPHQAVVLEVEGDGVHVEATSEEALEFVVFSGKPLNEPIVQYGPFVMTSEDEIRQTIYDFQAGKNGFEKAPTWQSKIGHRH